MRFRVRQTMPKYVDRAKDIVEWFVHEHLGPQAEDEISINLYLRWTNLLDLKESMCWPTPTKNRYTLIITTRAHGSEYTFVRDALHEMVHLEQHYTGRLKFLSTHVRYNDKNYYRDVPYWERPWEIEAFGKELLLVDEYLDARGIRDTIVDATVRKVIL